MRPVCRTRVQAHFIIVGGDTHDWVFPQLVVASVVAVVLLGCTFRLSFQFLGCRNPGQDSCSGRIPAESGCNIPDVPLLRAGTLLLLP
jgi:hypothetical protein